ncbi:hypothetical protein BKA70DRAFT_669626 [Coprinopsis sp. MPI-PUGE-AT-0042]|nr:hypothetical protein BKA70DRAFT_669626 [Coprinopsis sp. MPI-PUGE-AT-0042]
MGSPTLCFLLVSIWRRGGLRPTTTYLATEEEEAFALVDGDPPRRGGAVAQDLTRPSETTHVAALKRNPCVDCLHSLDQLNPTGDDTGLAQPPRSCG